MDSVDMTNIVTPGLSHIRGRDDVPMLNTTIYRGYQTQATRIPQRTVLVSHHERLKFSFSELLVKVDSLAGGLAQLGMEPQDRLGIWMQNCADWLVVQLAAAKVAAILTNLNPDYKAPELEYALNLVACKVLVMQSRTSFADYVAMLLELCPELKSPSPGPLKSKRVPSLRHVFVTGNSDVATSGVMPFHSLFGEDVFPEAALDPSEPVNIQFTSGTTGKPKATILAHNNILDNAMLMGRTMYYNEFDSICTPVPLFHCFGCVMSHMCMVASGCTVVYPSSKFDPLATLEAIAEHGCTSLYGVPTMYIAMLDHPKFKNFKITTLRTGIMAGSTVPVATMNWVIEEMGAKDMTITFGMTETSPCALQVRVGTDVELRCTTVGQVLPHTEVMIVDPETLEILPCGQQGEVWIGGYLVMKGYWNNKEATAKAVVMKNGTRFMRTGDLGTIDSKGFVRIVGRIKDMILRGGENIFPKEIEDPLIAHPDVANASVIGVPDERLGEQVCAWVTLKAGLPSSPAVLKSLEASLRQHCSQRLAHFKVPKYFFFKDAFPLTPSGKVRKVEMAEVSARELGLGRQGEREPASAAPPSRL